MQNNMIELLPHTICKNQLKTGERFPHMAEMLQLLEENTGEATWYSLAMISLI
jgi:hypothetical protein